MVLGESLTPTRHVDFAANTDYPPRIVATSAIPRAPGGKAGAIRGVGLGAVVAMMILAQAYVTPCLAAGAGAASTSGSEVGVAEQEFKAALTRESRAREIERGAKVYAQACAACHGSKGRGDGPAAAELVPWPTDFVAGKFRYRSTRSGEPPRRADIENAVRRGRTGTAMPAFGGLLQDDEIAAVVELVRSLRSPPMADREPEALPLPEFPPATAESIADGRALYLALGCWKCHGTDGSGRGPSAGELKNDEGQPIRPRDFRYDPFRGGRTPETVARAALSGLIGTPMPSAAEIMVVPREAFDALLDNIPAEVRPDFDEFRRKAPSAAEVVALDDDAWQAARDRNLVSLANYVLSLSRRDRLVYRLFRQEPELEERKP